MRLALAASLLLTATSLAQSSLETARGFKDYSGPAGSTLWHAFKKNEFPKVGWKIDAGQITQTGPGGGDLVTKDEFTDFELTCSFKLDAKANSGIMWRVAESLDATWQTGPEFQLLEDSTYPDREKLKPAQLCGALYDLLPPAPNKSLNPAGQWNQARIYLRNGLLQHWLNGKKVAETTIQDPTGAFTKSWTEMIAASKFKDFKGFGVQPKGAIALQDHGGGIAFRDVKVRDLADETPGPTRRFMRLFNGKDLKGWVPIVPGAEKAGIKPADVWSVKDGVLVCKGTPAGYIRTDEKYTNFIFRVEWRFNPEKAGNSGVLLRMVGEDKVWPKSVEAQLQSGQAGDFWNIDEFKMTPEAARTNGRNTKRTHTAERPLGEWNEYEIIVNHGEVVLYVNGEELNRATNVEEVPGFIALQSEGAEIQFRNIRLTPLE